MLPHAAVGGKCPIRHHGPARTVGMPLTRRALVAAAGGLIPFVIGCSSRRAQPGVVEQRIAYGDGPDQYGLLSLPEVSGAMSPIVVLIHGGFWREAYGADLMSPLASDLRSRGFAVWNIEYRRVGQRGGGYPGTLVDVATAVDHLATLADTYPIDLGRLSVIGHSAGGHLALWANSRSRLGPGDAGSKPRVRPVLAVGQAAVVDLVAAAKAHLGGNAVQDLLGGEPDALPDAYRVAQPDLDVGRIVLIHGTADDIVPPSQSSSAGSHPNVAVQLLDGLDHFDMIDKTSPAWVAVVDLLATVS